MTLCWPVAGQDGHHEVAAVHKRASILIWKLYSTVKSHPTARAKLRKPPGAAGNRRQINAARIRSRLSIAMKSIEISLGHEVTEARIDAFQVVVAFCVGDVTRPASVSRGPGYPDRTVVPERFAHQGQLRLIVPAMGDAECTPRPCPSRYTRPTAVGPSCYAAFSRLSLWNVPAGGKPCASLSSSRSPRRSTASSITSVVPQGRGAVRAHRLELPGELALAADSW